MSDRSNESNGDQPPGQQPGSAADRGASRTRRRRWPYVIAGLGALGVIGAFAVPYVYIHFIRDPPPPRLSFEQRDAEASTAAAKPSCVEKQIPTKSAIAVVRAKVGGSSVEATTKSLDGTAMLCGDTFSSATIDIDLSSLTPKDGSSDVGPLMTFLQTTDFPVLTVTVIGSAPGAATVSAVGEDLPVQSTWDASVSAEQVTVDGKLTLKPSEYKLVDRAEVKAADDMQFDVSVVYDPAGTVAAS